MSEREAAIKISHNLHHMVGNVDRLEAALKGIDDIDYDLALWAKKFKPDPHASNCAKEYTDYIHIMCSVETILKIKTLMREDITKQFAVAERKLHNAKVYLDGMGE